MIKMKYRPAPDDILKIKNLIENGGEVSVITSLGRWERVTSLRKYIELVENDKIINMATIGPENSEVCQQANKII